MWIVYGLYILGFLVEDGCILVYDKGNMNLFVWINVYVYSLVINIILVFNVGYEIYGWVGSCEFYLFLICIGLLVLMFLLLVRKM